MSSHPMRAANRRRLRSGALAAALLGSLLVGTFATSPATANDATASASRLVLTATADPTTSQYITWRTPNPTSNVVEIRDVGTTTVRQVTADLVDTITVTSIAYSHHSATVTGLTPGTAYEYRVGGEGDWTDWRTFRTAAASAKPFEFLYFGDAQISLDTTWPTVVNAARAKAPNAAGSVHAGDLIDTASNQTQWTNWFNGMGELAKTTQVLAAPGNHEYSGDSQMRNWKAHFEYAKNQPSLATIGDLADRAEGDSPAAQQHAAYFQHWSQFAADTVYYIDYQNVRFITLNATRDSNFLRPASLPACSTGCPSASNLWIEYQAAWLDHILENNPNKWSVATFHQPVYSVSSGRDEPVLRANWVPVFQKHNIDLVLQGHDHTYARGYNNADVTDTTGLTTGPVYAVANSGGKYYALASAASNVWTNNNATQVKRGANISSYQVISVDGDTLEYNSYVAARNGNTPEQVGDLYDSFTITKNAAGKFVTEPGVEVPGTEPAADEQQLEVVVPEVTVEPGEFVWSIDGGNGLVQLGTARESGDHFAADGSINPVRVTDTRLGAPAWSVAGQLGDFTSGGETIEAKYLGWAPALVEAGGGAIAGGQVASGFHGGNGLQESALLGSASSGHVLGSALLGASLDLRVPITSTDGTYRATLTLTALS